MRNRLVVVAAVDIPHEKTLDGFRAEIGFAEHCWNLVLQMQMQVLLDRVTR